MKYYLFAIKNIATNKSYVGIAKNPYSTRDIHFRLLRQFYHFLRPMQKDYNTHGLENIRYRILETSDDRLALYKFSEELIQDEPQAFYNERPHDVFIDAPRE